MLHLPEADTANDQAVSESVRALTDDIKNLIVKSTDTGALVANAVLLSKLALLNEIMESYRIQMGYPIDALPFSRVFNSIVVKRALAEEAERAYRTVLMQAPNLAEAHYGLGCVLRSRGASAEALKHFHLATLWPPHPGARPHALITANAFFEAGALLAADGKPNQAEAAFAQALQRLDRFGVDHERIAAFYRSQNRTELALEHYDRGMSYMHRYHPQLIPPNFELAMPTPPAMPALDPAADDTNGYAFLRFGWEVAAVPRVLLPFVALDDLLTAGGRAMPRYMNVALVRLARLWPNAFAGFLARGGKRLIARYALVGIDLLAVRRGLESGRMAS